MTGQKKSGAVFTTPEDSQMMQVGMEAVLLVQSRSERRQHLFIQVDDLAAPGADQMVVMLMSGAMEPHAAVAHVGFGYHPHLFKQFEGAIDGGDVEPMIALADILVDLLGADVPAGSLDGLQDHEALGRHAVALLGQACRDILALIHNSRHFSSCRVLLQVVCN